MFYPDRLPSFLVALIKYNIVCFEEVGWVTKSLKSLKLFDIDVVNLFRGLEPSWNSVK